MHVTNAGLTNQFRLCGIMKTSLLNTWINIMVTKRVICINCNMEFHNAEDTIHHFEKYHRSMFKDAKSKTTR